MDEDVPSDNTCLPLYTKTKRFKQDEYSKIDHNIPAVKDPNLRSCKSKTKHISRFLKKSSNCDYNKVNGNAFYLKFIL